LTTPTFPYTTLFRSIETPKGGLLTIGIIGALWSASNGVNAFIKSANSAYGVEETRSFIVVRAMALGLTIGLIIALGVAITLPIRSEEHTSELQSRFD